jgi:hypothetical protein
LQTEGALVLLGRDREGGVLKGQPAYFHNADGTVVEFIDLSSYTGNRL